MRMTRTRVISQAFFFGLFAFLIWVTEFGHLRGYPVSLLLEVDPLVATATAIAGHSLYHALVWSLVVLLPALLLGRFFCGWICPLGTLNHFVGWVFEDRGAAARIEANRYRRSAALKYYFLFAFLAAALLGSLQIGLLDPIATLYRSVSVTVLPVLDALGMRVYVRPHVHRFAWVVGFLLLGLLAANVARPRFFCRVLCPLGAGLGLLSRFSLWRIDRDPERCVSCDRCLARCEGASDPQGQLRKSECFVCLNCLDDCPHEALRFAALPPVAREVAGPDLQRRRALFAGLSGALFFLFSRRSGDLDRAFAKEVMRPPGSLGELQFLERCIKCEQCVRVCPTNVLQPALFEAGVEGLWTPLMNTRMGYCEVNCVLCGQVCPTGAIQPISLDFKHGTGEHAARGPVRTGTAFYDRGRCLPWAMDRPCVVCEEVCPTSPKAIYTREEAVVDRDGRSVTLHRPYVDPERCTGCGICEHECPVRDHPAIRVTAIGETRSRDRSLLLERT